MYAAVRASLALTESGFAMSSNDKHVCEELPDGGLYLYGPYYEWFISGETRRAMESAPIPKSAFLEKPTTLRGLPVVFTEKVTPKGRERS